MSEHGCGCNDCNRRDFLAAAGLTAGLVAMQSLATDARETDGAPLRRKQGATVRAVFLYPPSQTFKDDPNGWWSWPGNEFDAEGRQTLYTETLRKIADKLAMTINVNTKNRKKKSHRKEYKLSFHHLFLLLRNSVITCGQHTRYPTWAYARPVHLSAILSNIPILPLGMKR